MQPPAILFDLDGTLVDSVYHHVLAWREALEQAGIELGIWEMSSTPLRRSSTKSA